MKRLLLTLALLGSTVAVADCVVEEGYSNVKLTCPKADNVVRVTRELTECERVATVAYDVMRKRQYEGTVADTIMLIDGISQIGIVTRAWDSPRKAGAIAREKAANSFANDELQMCLRK